MSDDTQQPEEPEKTIYERDKTAKEPKVAPRPEGQAPPRPSIKPRKVFQPKKIRVKSDKPMEHRVRHIRVASMDAAQIIRQTLLDFQKELADQPADDPDKEFHDWEKVEKLFSRLARKYSTCVTAKVGGDLDWVYPKMPEVEEVLTEELRDALLKCERFVIPEPIRSKLGVHVAMVCESRICKRLVEEKSKVDPRYQALMDKDRPRTQAPPKSMDIPS